MALYGFRERFAPAIEDGSKRQTIRARRKDKRVPKPGEILHLYTGLRTKQCRKLGMSPCLDVRNVMIDNIAVSIDGEYLSGMARNKFAIADGFGSWEEMRTFFDLEHGLPFEGHVIRWKELVR